MKKAIATAVIGGAVLLIDSACSSAPHDEKAGASTAPATSSTTAKQSPKSAQQAAEAIKAAIPQVTSLVAITEDNDPNHKIGRPNGYVAATVIVDSRAADLAESGMGACTTDKPGVDCGATIEQWPNESAAQKRADYIKSIFEGSPMLGSEYETVKGSLLLRVSGKLKPSAAQAYQQAFQSS